MSKRTDILNSKLFRRQASTMEINVASLKGLINDSFRGRAPILVCGSIVVFYYQRRIHLRNKYLVK